MSLAMDCYMGLRLWDVWQVDKLLAPSDLRAVAQKRRVEKEHRTIA